VLSLAPPARAANFQYAHAGIGDRDARGFLREQQQCTEPQHELLTAPVSEAASDEIILVTCCTETSRRLRRSEQLLIKMRQRCRWDGIRFDAVGPCARLDCVDRRFRLLQYLIAHASRKAIADDHHRARSCNDIEDQDCMATVKVPLAPRLRR
jgi:hypothetical protein